LTSVTPLMVADMLRNQASGKENDIKTLNICEYSDQICAQKISLTPYLSTNPFW